jgi:hypothetical protein
MRKKMRKYQPGGSTTRTQPNPVNPVAPVAKEPVNTGLQNAGQPQAAQTPVTPITNSATAQAPAMDPLLAANEKYTKLGYNPRKARRMAMKEVNPLNRDRISGKDVLGTAGNVLKLANESAGTIGAFRSVFNQNGGVVSGKQLRKANGFMEDGGSVKKAGRKATRAMKKYIGAEKAYTSGNMKKGARKEAKGDKIARKVNKLQESSRPPLSKTRKR